MKLTQTDAKSAFVTLMSIVTPPKYHKTLARMVEMKIIFGHHRAVRALTHEP